MNYAPKIGWIVLVVLLGWPAMGWSQDEDKLDAEQMQQMLSTIDNRLDSLGDYEATVLIEHQEKGKDDLVYKVQVYRRDEDDRMVLRFLEPKTEAGSGYIIAGDNVFYYDPKIGKWERRTVREQIGGTESRQRDFGAWDLSKNYTASYVGTDKLGKYEAYRLKLTAKDGVNVAFPIKEIWIAKESKNILKLQYFSKSGKLMRSSYYPKWSKVKNKADNETVYVPKQIHHFSETEKGKQSIMVITSAKIQAVSDTVFTKAWLESKSR